MDVGVWGPKELFQGAVSPRAYGYAESDGIRRERWHTQRAMAYALAHVTHSAHAQSAPHRGRCIEKVAKWVTPNHGRPH